MKENTKPVILVYRENRIYQYADLDELIVSNMLSYYSTLMASNYISEIMERLHIGQDIIKTLLGPCIIDLVHNYVFTIHNVHAGVFTDAGVFYMSFCDHDHVSKNRNHIINKWNVLRSTTTSAPISMYKSKDDVSVLTELGDKGTVQLVDNLAKLVRENALVNDLKDLYNDDELEAMILKSLTMYNEHLNFDYVNKIM